MPKPLVSIVIPCFNAAPWVGAAIESALAQAWQPLEVLVHDDGSTDGSDEVIARYGDRITVSATSNRGQNPSRNHLTRAARGEWVAFLDADDELPSGHIDAMMARTADAVAVYASVERVFYRGEHVFQRSLDMATAFDDPWCAAFLWRYPNTSSFLLHRQSIERAGGWNENLENCTDYALYFDLLLNGGHFNPAPDTTVIYRQWSSAQAVYQDDRRRCQTRIDLLWEKALAKDATPSPLTLPQRLAFEEALFGCVRDLFNSDPAAAKSELNRLKAWNPDWRPHGRSAPRSFRAAYAMFGYSGAERLAAGVRRLKGRSAPIDNLRGQFGEN